jgi:hypothetical protein
MLSIPPVLFPLDELDRISESLVGLLVGASVMVSETISVLVLRVDSVEVEVASVVGVSRVLAVVGEAGGSLKLEAESSEVVVVLSALVVSAVVVGEEGVSSIDVVVSATAAATADKGLIVVDVRLSVVRGKASSEDSAVVASVSIPVAAVSSSSPKPSSRFTRALSSWSAPPDPGVSA